MKKLCLIILAVFLLNVSALNYAYADVPYQVAVCYPVQVVNERESVKGIRYNFIYGVNNDVSGLDFGLVNQVDGVQKGLQLGFFNKSFKTNGVQIGFFNKTEYLNGIQIGLLNFHTEGDRKIFPIINYAF